MRKFIFITFLLFGLGVNGQSLTSLEFEDDLTDFDANSVKAETEVLKTVSTKKMSLAEQKAFNSRLLKKADAYFAKMWYSEAAQLYDLALKENLENHSMNLLQRAGDSHYFNSNMEMAHHWYSRMFQLYQMDISDASLFKYAHILKGTGRYNKAERLLKLFNKENSKKELALSEKQLLEQKANMLKRTIQIKNLDVNTQYSDFSPMVWDKDKLVFASAKDSSFFTTRRYKWNNQPYLDLYVGKVGANSEKLEGVSKFSKTINSKYHEAAVSFSPDNNTMYFTRNNYGKRLKRDKNGVNHLKIYMSRKTGDEWSEAVELPFNSENYSAGHPAVSPDGKKLYFVSDMPGGFGGTDIYVVDILENGKFSKAKNLGRSINTSKKEMFPFVTENTIYFSSDRAFGLGGLDIYKAKFTNSTFEVAINVGQPINSNRDDFSYIIDEATNKGYFASNRKGGKGDDDIYSFKQLIVKNTEEESTIIVGTVTEFMTGAVLPNALVSILDENKNTLKEMYAREDGSFVFDDLSSKTTYTVTTNSMNYLEDIQLVSTEEKKRIELDVVLRGLDNMIVYEDGVKKLKTDVVYFDFDQHNINQGASAELDKLIEVWAKYPSMVIKIESHTDSRGSRVYNQILSDRRAKSTRDYLLSKGISPSLIESAKGFGEDVPVNQCKDGVGCEEHNHQNNRRSEFIIVKL